MAPTPSPPRVRKIISTTMLLNADVIAEQIVTAAEHTRITRFGP